MIDGAVILYWLKLLIQWIIPSCVIIWAFMTFESHHLIYYAVIWQTDSKEFCFVVSCVNGMLFLLAYLRDPSLVLCSFLYILISTLSSYPLLFGLVCWWYRVRLQSFRFVYCGDCLKSDLDAVVTWLHSFHLYLNVGKSNCMLIKGIIE